MRVLIVEDEKPLRTALSDAFIARGHEVVAVGDAESALRLYNDHHYPMIVLDWLLPGMTGIDLCRVIRKLPHGGLPFIMLATARTAHADLEAGLASGIDDYLAKPLVPELLNTRLVIAEQVIRQRKERHEAEHRFESIFRQSPDAIALVRQLDGVVVDANDSFARLFGVTRAEVLDPTNRLVGERLVSKLDLASGRRVFSEAVIIERPPHNQVVHTLTSVEGVDVAGEPCWLVMCHDVTERERLRSQLMFAEKMASVGTLAAGVAHEINNPLAYMVANLCFVLDEVKQRLPDKELLEALGETMHGADRVKNIVQDLKRFSRDDAEQPGPVDVREVLDSSINLAWNEIRHRARLVKEYAADLPSVFGNKGRLGQVFVNLLINAAQAIGEGDANKNVIRVITRMHQGRVVIEVKDTGPGIRPEHMRRIFDPFFTTKPVGVGTGLGLSICHAIVTSLGGAITAESEVGRGATFAVSLTATSAPVAMGAVARSSTPAAKRARILLIDDEVMIGKSLIRALSAEHDIETVTSARDALHRLAQGHAYDLILCDLMMPEMSGMDFHAEMERHYRLLLGKLVFVTGGAFTPRARAFVERSGIAVLEKPLDLSILRRMVGERLAHAEHPAARAKDS